MATENDGKNILINLPHDLYQRFQGSVLRSECNTDSEGVRAAIRKVLDDEGACQAKNPDKSTGGTEAA